MFGWSLWYLYLWFVVAASLSDPSKLGRFRWKRAVGFVYTTNTAISHFTLAMYLGQLCPNPVVGLNLATER